MNTVEKKQVTKNNKKRRLLAVAAIIMILVLVVIILIKVFNQPRTSSDFSKLAWTDAFTKLHERMSKEYAFTDWKRIDWNALYEKYHVQMENAQANNDFDSYYLALRSYLHEIPDGHVGMNNLVETDFKFIGGGFGLAVADIDDGRFIVTRVDETGPARAAGIHIGAELIEWDGRPIADAVSEVSTVFATVSATTEDLAYKKSMYLARAPIGKQTVITFMNPDDPKKYSVILTAYDDNGESFKRNYPDSVISDKIRDLIKEVDSPDPMPEAMVEQKTLEGNISYIRIWGELDADLQQTGKITPTLELFRSAIHKAIDDKASGLIIDVRNNIGGLDEMAASILGSFYSEKTFYEYQNVYNPGTGEREIVQADSKTDSLALYIEPASLCYTGRIIALTNSRCISSGEGIAMGIKNLPNGETLGFYGTNGSFGLCGPEALMPGSLTVRWPSGQSLNENKVIQLDSRNGVGGVSPSIRIPMTYGNAMRIANGEDVELEEAIRILNSTK